MAEYDSSQANVIFIPAEDVPNEYSIRGWRGSGRGGALADHSGHSWRPIHSCSSRREGATSSYVYHYLTFITTTQIRFIVLAPITRNASRQWMMWPVHVIYILSELVFKYSGFEASVSKNESETWKAPECLETFSVHFRDVVVTLGPRVRPPPFLPSPPPRPHRQKPPRRKCRWINGLPVRQLLVLFAKANRVTFPRNVSLLFVLWCLRNISNTDRYKCMNSIYLIHCIHGFAQLQ